MMINTLFPQAHASLQFVNGPLVGNTVSISKQDTRIGSDPSLNDIVLSDPSIQPCHARIYVSQEQFIVQGYDSQCFVSVNRHSVPDAILSDGDEVSLGMSDITFLWTAPPRAQISATPKNLPTPSQNLPTPPQNLPTPSQNLSPLSQNSLTPSPTPPLPAQSPAPPSQALPAGFIPLPYTETTRYLCAAAHLDEDFREHAIKNVFEEDHRAVGESYGVDIIPVAKWCYAARQRVFYRDLILFIALLALLFSRFFPGLLLRVTQILLPSDYFSQQAFSQLSYLVPVLPVVILFILAIPLLFLGLFFRSLRRHILQVLLLLFFSLLFPLLIPCFLVAWIITLVEQIASYSGSNTASLAKGRFRPDGINWSLDPQLEQKLRNVFHTQDGNAVVYSGYLPFAGAGVIIRDWSFAVDISKGKKEIDGMLKTPVAFQISELYEEITRMIEKLGLNNVSLEDKLYVNGQSIRDNTNFLPDRFSRPYTQVAPKVVNDFKENPSEYIRYYKCVRITSWDGEMILSIFVRFKLAGKNLFVEADYQLLPPVKEEYHEIDTIEPTLTMSKFLRFTGQTFYPAFLLLLRSPVRVFNYVFHDQLLARKRTRVENSIKENPAFDYGTSTSLREVASSSHYQLYFQRLDKEMYVKIIERQLLDSITNFLDTRNIDTTDLKSRQDTIQNSNVIVSGNIFQESNFAVGDRAKQTILTSSASDSGEASGKTSQ